MGKPLYIAEKPSVAQQFAAALGISGRRGDGYVESDTAVVTWCVGHLVTMSYPEVYDPRLKRWSLQTLPFLPKEFRYEVIGSVSKQFGIVKKLLTRSDIDTIYICTDSGREGEYIYRLVDQMAGVDPQKVRRRVWIDSQTEEEILRGIREAKDWREYDNLAASAYLRAKEDYLMGINFSRLMTLKYGPTISRYLAKDRTVISIGRVMTCVLGMTVRREREIRDFVKTPFYRVIGNFEREGSGLDGEWKSVEGSEYYQSPYLYKENGFRERRHAEELIAKLQKTEPFHAVLNRIEKKKETKAPPLLYNLAELQNDCSRMFKISPDETLKVVQELYEKKLVTYPRTDARVLSSAVAKEIGKNIGGLKGFEPLAGFAAEVLGQDAWKKVAKSRYVNDKQITDHYAIIPTGQGLGTLRSLSPLSFKVYELIGRRFLSVFYPAAVYQKFALELVCGKEHFFANFKILKEPGYLKVAAVGGKKDADVAEDPALPALLDGLKKGMEFGIRSFTVKEGETTPPKRYTSGSMILATENAGQLIEDEELRAQIRGSGIGTSATRAEILKKLVNIKYLALNKKTQVITPTLLGELIYETVFSSMKQMLNPDLTASWEKGLTYVAEGSITPEEYMEKLERFVRQRTAQVMQLHNEPGLQESFNQVRKYYIKSKKGE
ncbi:MAG: type IA DNA topoisomerase [Clostridiales bacterium]|nr:type IA DNA topoisomerase [Clostridiales bacterium]